MTIEKGVTEIADSEHDPMTSSPGVVPDEAAEKLCAVAGAPYQERQDALHEADDLHQAFIQRDANAALFPAEVLDVDRYDAPVDDASKFDQTNMTPQNTNIAQEEGATVGKDSYDLGLHSRMYSLKPESTTGAKSDESNVMMVQALPATDSQPREHVPARRVDTDTQRQRTNHTAKDDPTKRGDVKDIEDAVVKDVQNDPPADCQAQQSTAGGTSPANKEQAATDSFHPIIPNTHIKAPSTTEQDSSYTSVNVQASDGLRSQLQDHPPRDSLFQDTADDGGQAAGHSSEYKHSNKNAVHTGIAPTATCTGNDPQEPVTDASDGTVADYATPNLSSGSEHHDAQDPRGTLCNSQVDADASGTAMSARETSSMIDQEQTLRRESADQHRAVKGTALSRKSADQSCVASSPTAEPSTHAQLHTGARSMASSAQTSPSKTPQEITLDELRTQKTALIASLGALPTIQVLIEENALSDPEPGDASDVPTETDIIAAANKIVKEHIKLLHEYNELKDVGQGLMGLIADQRGVRIVEVQEEFGIDAED